jgi:ketosteroid isomerase-like protein
LPKRSKLRTSTGSWRITSILRVWSFSTREYLGWDAYKKDWQGLFALIDGPFTLFEVKDLAVNVDGNLAYSYSFQHSVGKTKAGGSRDVTVRVTDVYRKTGDKWLIVQEHVSAPVDLQTGKAGVEIKSACSRGADVYLANPDSQMEGCGKRY